MVFLIVIFLSWFVPRLRPAKLDVLRVLLSNKRHLFVYFEQFPPDRIKFRMSKTDPKEYAIDYKPQEIYENPKREWYQFHIRNWRYITLLEGAPTPAGERTFLTLSHLGIETYPTLMHMRAVDRTQQIERQLTNRIELPWAIMMMAIAMVAIIFFFVGMVAGPHLGAIP